MRAALVLSLLALGVPVSALTVKPLSFTELVTASAHVVHGRVRDVHSQWTADRRGIESLVEIDADGYLKGGLGERVTVKVPGGRLGPYVNLIPGAPQFAAGERVVLFLTVQGPTVPVVTGTSQGVFRLRTDPASGAELVTPPVIETAGPPTARGDATRRSMPLGAFGDAVRRAEAAR